MTAIVYTGFFSFIKIWTFYWIIIFSKFYGKLGVISWFLFHLIWKNYVLYCDFDWKSWIMDFFTRFTRDKTPQSNFSSQNFSVENNYSICWSSLRCTDHLFLLCNCVLKAFIVVVAFAPSSINMIRSFFGKELTRHRWS